MITLSRDLCVDLNQSLNREWLVANGIGGYASSTPAGINTRRYHGLLVAALKPPVERTVLLSSIEEEAQIENRAYYLGANEYPEGKIHPSGFVYIDEFRVCDGIPTTIFRIGGSILSKTVWMERGHNTSYIRYTYLQGNADCRLVLNPMCNYRDYHGVTSGSLDWNFAVEPVHGGCKVTAYEGAVPYWITGHQAAQFTHTGVWYWKHCYRTTTERGFPETEDLYMPGLLRATLRVGQSFTLVASTDPPEMTTPLVERALEREEDRQRALLVRAGVPPEAEASEAADPLDDRAAFVAQLVRAADTFLVERQATVEGKRQAVPTVLAGYHWFTDWGRDTMISLPGLCIATGSADLIGQILRTFAAYADQGLIPNTFPDSGDEPMYNTADATLLLIATAERAARSGDTATIRDLYPVMASIIDWHMKGTRFGIGMDPSDGLLRAGEEGFQLTWMDAKIDDWVVTPRIGKPVEINALWCKALQTMDEWSTTGLQKGSRKAKSSSQDLPDFGALARKARHSFAHRFWYEQGGYLYDVVDGPNGDDASLRPNQVLALALVPGLVSNERARSVLRVVREKLMTPYGLRSLSPDDPEYKPYYVGDRRARDAAYHQGTVWAWLLGPYFDAVRAVEGNEAARSDLLRILPSLRTHMGTAGLGSISEIFDAEPPHAPKGCISQAWSVAEILRHVWGPDSLL